MKRLALLVTLSLLSCGLCFAQNGHQPAAATRQISYGDCSFNLAQVRGNVKISFSGSACNDVFSASIEKLLRQLLPLLQSDVDYRTSVTSYSPFAGLGCGAIAPLTTVNVDAVAVAQGQTPFGWANASAPLELTTSLDVSKISTIGDSADIVNFESVSREFNISPIKPDAIIVADYMSPPSGTVDTGAQIPSGVIPAGVVVAWSPSLSLANITSGGADNGVQLPAGLTISGTSINSAPFDSASITISPSPVLLPSESSVADMQYRAFIHPDTSTNGAAFDLASSISSVNSPLNLSDGAAGIGVQSPVGLVSPGAWTDGTSVFNSLPLTGAPLDASTTIAGTDDASLARSLSDIASSGRIITGWTVTYR